VRKPAQETKIKMLEAAARKFGPRHFHEARMDDIATEAGVGKGTLYRYFKDKEELYVALLEHSARQFVLRLQEAIGQAERPRDQLVAVVAAIIRFFDEQPHLFSLIQRSEVMARSSDAFPWQKTRDELFQAVQCLFDRGKACGDFTIRDPKVMMLMLLGGLRSVIRFGEHPRPHDLAQRIVTAFLNGADIANGP
jgi:TetR/AcrR family fatty acid metabolism transcriptional regulator